jgi:hypothetical protein
MLCAPLTSGVVSELLPLKARYALSCLKVRAANSFTRSDTDPCQLANTYLYNNTWGQYMLLSNSENLNNALLLPEQTESVEGGGRLFKELLHLSATAYYIVLS